MGGRGGQVGILSVVGYKMIEATRVNRRPRGAEREEKCVKLHRRGPEYVKVDFE